VQVILRDSARSACEPAADRVLYIADDIAQKAAFARSFAAYGFRVDAAAESEALRLAARFPYPVIVTELRAANDSLALISELHHLQPDASVVVTTSDCDELADPNPLLDSVARLVRKPWNEVELAEILRHACAQHRERKADLPNSLEEHWSVLLVEDDRQDAQLVTQYLKQCGACGDVAHCARLTSALALLGAQTFDVVMFALDLPDAVGLDALGEFQRAAPEAALIALRGESDAPEPANLLPPGAQDVLVKRSFERAGLRQRLTDAVACKRHERAIGY